MQSKKISNELAILTRKHKYNIQPSEYINLDNIVKDIKERETDIFSFTKTNNIATLEHRTIDKVLLF
jgi:hypothetical protein